MVDTRAIPSQFYVRIRGKDATEDLMHDLHEVTVETNLHLPGVATLLLNDAQLRWIDDPQLLPGGAIEILASEQNREELLFDGDIVELEPEFQTSIPRLVVRAFDRLHRLNRGRRVRSFQQMSDGDLVQKLASEAGLTASVVPARVIHPYVLQRNQTGLEFLRERAMALGYVLYARGSTVHFEPPAATGKPIELAWGTTLREFRPRLTTLGQVQDVIARGWDPETRQAIIAEAQNDRGRPEVGESRAGGELSKAAFHLDAHDLVAQRPLRMQSAAEALADATAKRNAGAFIEAEGTCSGDASIQAGARVTITGVGDRFGGTYFVTSALHTYGMTGYRTQFSVSGGRSRSLLSVLADGQHSQSASHTHGLVIGIVTDNRDPQGQGRVKLNFPWLADAEASDWARVVAVGGGDQRGIEFLPEINDEVLVGFEQGDMHYPYVLGGLWNGHDAPPLPTDQAVKGGKVEKRVIRSRSGHTITLDDSSSGGGIIIEDPRGNRIELDTSSNALKIEVLGDASLKAAGNLTLEATGQVQLKGMGVTVDGGAATVDVRATVINLN